MLIGIEAERANNPQKTGVEHYAKQLILHLAKVDSDNRYILYLRSQPQEWFLSLPKNFQIKVIPFPVFWTQIRLSLEMLLHPIDVLMIPASALPIIHPKRSVVTIHDLAWKFYPETFTPFMKAFLEWSTRFAVSHASQIIAVSEATKKDLVKFYGIEEGRVSVVYHGFENRESASQSISGSGNQQVSQSADQGIRESGGQRLPEKYILFLSTLQPRKNLEGLIDAFRNIKQQYPELPHKLLVVGKPGWKYDSILKKIEDNKDIVVYLGYAPDEERRLALLGADVLVQPAFYEGFGMQILEALEAGIPVAASNVSSLPEVAGEAAVYFDPHDTRDMAKTISSVLFDKSLADRLRDNGRKRLQNFSWEKCAKETLGILNKNN